MGIDLVSQGVPPHNLLLSSVHPDDAPISHVEIKKHIGLCGIPPGGGLLPAWPVCLQVLHSSHRSRLLSNHPLPSFPKSGCDPNHLLPGVPCTNGSDTVSHTKKTEHTLGEKLRCYIFIPSVLLRFPSSIALVRSSCSRLVRY